MDGFEKLIEEHRGALERFVKFRLSDPGDAEDVLQEIWLAAYGQFSRLKSPEAFKPWLLGIARNKCADYYRNRFRETAIPLDDVPEEQLAETMPDPAGDHPVWDTLDRMSPRDREILSLFYLEDLPQAEIGLRMCIPTGTVKSRLHTARDRFRSLYPAPPTQRKGESIMKEMPKLMPEYIIEPVNEAPFPVVWEELMGWFLVPRPGESLRWGIYDQPSRRLDVAYEARTGGRASVHGVEGVEVFARVLVESSDPVGDPGNPANMDFVAQLTDTHCRFLACSRTVEGVREYRTFLDGDAFLHNWGFGENNCGNETHLTRKGDITRTGDEVVSAQKDFLLDVVGRYTVTIGGKQYDTICVMDVETYNTGVVSEQFLDKEGRTVLWRRFNRNNWGYGRYGKLWTELLPENQVLTVNGEPYVHWYDCITDRIL